MKRKTTHKKRLCRIHTLILSSLLLTGFLLLASGCGSGNDSPDSEDPSAEQTTESITTGNTSEDNTESTEDISSSAEEPSTEESSASDPSGSGDGTALLTSDEAMSLIRERINTDIYTVELVEESVSVEGKDYYQFLVSSNGSAVYPYLIVDKQSGTVFCYTEEGEVRGYSSFPLYDASVDAVCDWNGIFSLYSGDGTVLSSIDLGQADSHSFEFVLTASGVELAGVAQIRGNTALYEADGYQLDFLMKEDSLVITESGTNPAGTSLSGEYRSEASAPEQTADPISSEEAVELVSSLTAEQTGLPAQLSEYTLTAEEGTVEINGNLCYSVCVYSDLGERMQLMKVFNVSVDGEHIYTFDIDSAQDIEIQD